MRLKTRIMLKQVIRLHDIVILEVNHMIKFYITYKL